MATKEPIKRGGARPNAGRRIELPIGTRRVNATLPDDTLEKARQIGNGNVSAGIRLAVEKFAL
jgi:hypothetical protein